MSAMDKEITMCIKKEEIDVVPKEPGSVVQVYQPTLKVKEEMEDGGNQESHEEPLCIEDRGLHIKQDPELELDVGGSEHNFVEHPLGTSWSTDFIEEVLEQGLEVDDFQNVVIASASKAPNSTRLIENTDKSCDISSEETVNQEVVNRDLEISSEESAHFTTFGEEEEVHIDGVKPPICVCKSCGEVLPNHISLKKHSKICQVGQILSANDEQSDCIGDQGSLILKSDQEDSDIEQPEKPPSSKKTRKVSEKSINEKYNTHTTTHNEELKDKNGDDGSWHTADDVNTHTDLLPAKKTRKCDVCGKSFARLCDLKRHLLVHTGTKSHKCDICGKYFMLLGDLKRHALIHSGVRPHKCSICGKSFTELDKVKRHALTHTGVKPHKCSVCSKSFSDFSNLKRHALLHTGTLSFECEICHESFTRLVNLKRHELIHIGKKPHTCDICGKSFILLAYLKRHAMIHTGMRPHKCNTCGKSFTVLAELKRHELIHTGTKPHKCDICGKSFTELGNLTKHALIHSGTKPHMCDICGKSFTQFCSLKRHSVIHTGSSSYEFDT